MTTVLIASFHVAYLELPGVCSSYDIIMASLLFGPPTYWWSVHLHNHPILLSFTINSLVNLNIGPP